MPSAIAAHFEDLRRRFPNTPGRQLASAQYSFEMMADFQSMTGRPVQCRSAYFEVGGIKYLVWEMDLERDQYQVFATIYNIPLGIIRLSSKPSGVITVAGFKIDLGALATFIAQCFGEARLPDEKHLKPDGTKRNLLLFGYSESFGHHFWNEVGGLSSTMACGLFDKIDGFVIGPFDYFNLAPLINSLGKPVWKMNSMGTLLPDQLVIYHNNVLTKEARQLVVENAAAQAQTPSIHQNNNTICFQIRRHKRCWIHEEEKLAEIIKTLATDWPEVDFVIDGFSTSKGLAPTWQQEIADEQAFFQRLSSRLNNIKVHSTIGMDMNEKINALKGVDFFVGPIGSGGVLSSWLLRKPTIIYGPTSMYGMVNEQEPNVPEGGPMVAAVPPEKIQDNPFGDQSFDVDTHSILELIRQQMAKQRAA